MAVDPRQLLLLLIALAVPSVAFLLGRTRIILAWVGFTLFVQVFDTSIVTNLPAGRVVGLLFLPAAVGLFREWSRLTPARAWLVNFAYLVLLGMLFGFLMPWPDISGIRPFTVRAPGRTIIYLIRTVSDLSLTVFVMSHVTRPGGFDTLRKWMVRGAAVSAAFAMTTLVTGIDFYTLITSLREYAKSDFRPRGLAFEPRGLGLACAYGLILLLSKKHRSARDWMLLFVIGAGLAVSSSSSALAATIVGLTVIAFLGSMRVRFAMVMAVALIASVLVVLAVTAPTLVERSRYAIESRLQGRGVVEANRPRNAGEAVALRMDVFDSAASLFLLRNPQYALTGTGPGLISLPASEHIPYGLYRSVFPVIDNPPSHGILLELSNTGVLGVTIWIFQVLAIYRAGRSLRRYRGLPFPPQAATTTFMVGAALYAIQVSPSPFWAVFLGVGWAIAAEGAALEKAKWLARRQARMAAPPQQPAPALGQT
ncbi:MAG TPA: hypothetical protein VF432_04835 [Thermoanaerobaculia bacterium]